MESIEDPLLKEVLASFKEDARNIAEDLLRGITTQALTSAFALFLAISSTIRLIIFESFRGFGMFGPPRPDIGLYFEVVLTLILFALSIVSLYNLFVLRSRYHRLLTLTERLGR